MTREEILAMKPGRELDALVGEYVFGFKRVKTPPDYYGKNGGTDVLVPRNLPEFYNYPPIGEIQLWYMCRHWSTDISAAWEVVEKMREKGSHFFVRDTGNNEVLVQFSYLYGRGYIAKTAPEAICKSSLLAVMEVEE